MKIKKKIGQLANLILQSPQVYRQYTKFHLSDAVVILQEPLMALTYKKCIADKLTEEETLKRANDLGKDINKLILKYTDVDLKKVYENI